jgi:O-antigen/teichoic acid export membrane protein
VAGGRARSLVARTYLLAAGAAGVGALVFAVGTPLWAEDLVGVRHPVPALGLAAATATWAIFTLQDAVLVGLRRAWAVPLTQGLFSLGKIAALVVFATAGVAGIVASWAVPALVSVVLVGRWAARRHLVPTPGAPAGDELGLRQVLAFTGAEHVASLLWRVATLVLPLVVLGRLGAAAGAHHYLADQVAYGLFLLSSNVGDALVATGSRGEAPLAEVVRGAARQVALLLVPGVLAVVALAPHVMGAFGPGYRAEGTTLLRLLAVAAVPNAVTTLVIGAAHVRRRLRPVVVAQAAIAVGSLGGSVALMGGHGIAGIGIAWCATQTVVAAGALAVAPRLLEEP